MSGQLDPYATLPAATSTHSPRLLLRTLLASWGWVVSLRRDLTNKGTGSVEPTPRWLAAGVRRIVVEPLFFTALPRPRPHQLHGTRVGHFSDFVVSRATSPATPGSWLARGLWLARPGHKTAILPAGSFAAVPRRNAAKSVSTSELTRSTTLWGPPEQDPVLPWLRN